MKPLLIFPYSHFPSGDNRLGWRAVLNRIIAFKSSVLIVLLILILNSSLLAGENLYKSDAIGVGEDIRIEGNRFFESSKLLSEMKLRGLPNYDLLEKKIERVLKLYEENGFPYCQISPSDFKATEKGRLAFSLRVNEGPRVKIKEIELDGLKTTKRKVILREMGRSLFGYFSQNQLIRSIGRIERLSYIKTVEDVQLLSGENPDEGILKITLEERKNNTFSGILGYAPSAGTRKGNLVGWINMNFDNIFGTGRRMEWDWSRKDAYSSRFNFLYKESWIFGLPPTLEFKTSQLDCDSTYLQLSFAAKLGFNQTDKLSWGIEAGWEKTIPGSAGKSYLPDSRKYITGLELTFDLLEPRDNPRRGLRYQAKMNYAQKRNYSTSIFVPDQLKVQSIVYSLELDNLVPVFGNQTVFAGVHFKGLNSNEKIIPFSDQFALGGINSLRGYREEEFFGTTIAWTNLEYRLLLDDNSRFFLFTDYGYFERKVRSESGGDLMRISDRKLGYGFGLRIDSKAGLLGLDYGLGEGDSFNRGKIHFGVINRF